MNNQEQFLIFEKKTIPYSQPVLYFQNRHSLGYMQISLQTQETVKSPPLYCCYILPCDGYANSLQPLPCQALGHMSIAAHLGYILVFVRRTMK